MVYMSDYFCNMRLSLKCLLNYNLMNACIFIRFRVADKWQTFTIAQTFVNFYMYIGLKLLVLKLK